MGADAEAVPHIVGRHWDYVFPHRMMANNQFGSNFLRLLMTGSYGLVGSALSKACLSAGHDVD